MTEQHSAPEDLMAWLDGELDAGRSAGIERHVGSCSACRAVADDLRRVRERLASWTVEPASVTRPEAPKPIPWRLITIMVAAALLLSLMTWSMHDWQAKAPAGSPDREAAVVVTVFIDWQCPSCLHLEYEPVMAAYQASKPGAVLYVLKDFPLNHRCNGTVRGEFHGAACEAAAAVRMARERGKEEEFVNWLVRNQPALTPERVKAAAKERLGVADFDAEYARTLPQIAADVAEGAALHLQFTPSVLINGVLQPNPPAAAELDRLIHAELTRRGR